MKEFIDRLLCRLEEESHNIYLDGYVASTQKKIIEFAGIEKAVREVAEEYNSKSVEDKIREWIARAELIGANKLMFDGKAVVRILERFLEKE